MQVCVVDKRLVEGRTQEWNISRGELRVSTNVVDVTNIFYGLLIISVQEHQLTLSFAPMRRAFWRLGY